MAGALNFSRRLVWETEMWKCKFLEGGKETGILASFVRPREGELFRANTDTIYTVTNHLESVEEACFHIRAPSFPVSHFSSKQELKKILMAQKKTHSRPISGDVHRSLQHLSAK